MILQFDFYDYLRFFKVEFETDSLQRNRLLNIEYEGFNLDIADLITMHCDLYVKIRNQMQEESKKYWNQVNPVKREITGIPTLDYQAKEPMATRAIDAVIKSSFRALTIIFLFLLPVFSFAQGFIGIEATDHGAGMNGGYMLNTIQLQAGFHSPITNDADKSFVGYASAGYQISINDFSILPALGIARFGTRDFSKYDGGIPVNKTALFTSLEIGKDAVAISGIQFRYYLFVDHAVKTFVGAGLKFFITK